MKHRIDPKSLYIVEYIIPLISIKYLHAFKNLHSAQLTHILLIIIVYKCVNIDGK